ncbi:glycosyltransferase [uncultured Formosa sp.]|uniref:glycosyltransferase n=1 Tax=uncultured Formosa sp. TaxID=255435 RepID=UPI002625ED52|nr:glycosyltransferase [uncultured Formosa sp.]
MRVLQLIDSLEAGGAERMAVNLANGLAEKEIDSFICVTRAEGPLKSAISNSVEYLFLKRKYLIDIRALKRLERFVKENNITIIHAHGSSFFIAWLLKLKLINLKLVWHDHNGNRPDVTGVYPKLLKLCSKKFSAVFCVNEVLEKWIQTELYCLEIQVVRNFPMIILSKDNTIIKGEQNKRILCLANLRYPKNHLLLLDSFKQVHSLYPDWSLHLVGKVYNDDYSNAVNMSIENKGLKNCVFLYDACYDTSNIISKMDIGVLSSDYEGLPMTLLEYGLGGISVVATNVGDNKKILKDVTYGQLVPAKDSKCLAESLLYFIQNPTERLKSAETLKLHINNNYSKDAVLNDVIRIYTAVNNS